MFIYAYDDALTRVEKLIMTLFEVGAMAQADLMKVLGMNDYTLSRTIASTNGGGKKDLKIGSIIERPGVRNSGKIRYLTRNGLEMVASTLGIAPPNKKLILNEAEVRITAQLAKYAATYNANKKYTNTKYLGPYQIAERYHLMVEEIEHDEKYQVKLPWPTAMLINFPEDTSEETEYVWLAWISHVMQYEHMEDRIEQWGAVVRRPKDFSKDYYAGKNGVVFVCPTRQLKTQIDDMASSGSMLRRTMRDVVSLDDLNQHDMYILRKGTVVPPQPQTKHH